MHRFDQTQFQIRIDADVAVAANSQTSSGSQEGPGREHAVAEIGFGARAQSDDAASCGEVSRFLPRHMGRVHEAPARVDIRMAEQPGDRPSATPGDAGVDFLALFGSMDMDRRAFELGACESDDLG